MAQQIQLRNGMSQTWTQVNPIMATGEVGVETDSAKLKIGDGSTHWNSLPYAGGAGGGGGTVTSVAATASVSHGFAVMVTNPTTTPNITIDWGTFPITPNGVASNGDVNVVGNATVTGNIAGNNLSGKNTGDQTIGLTGFVTGGPSSPTTTIATTIGGTMVPVANLPVMHASGPSPVGGIVPTPPSSANTTHFLREDATWAVPPSGGGGGSQTSVVLIPSLGSGQTSLVAETAPLPMGVSAISGTMTLPAWTGKLLASVATFNVMDYGATGTGTSSNPADDCLAIQNCIYDAMIFSYNGGGSVRAAVVEFEPLSYSLKSWNQYGNAVPYTYFLLVDYSVYPGVNLRFSGKGATIISAKHVDNISSYYNTLLFIKGNGARTGGLWVEGFNFSCTHANGTPTINQAIQFTDPGSSNINGYAPHKNVVITGCTFNSFAIDISLLGCDCPRIMYNTFLSPLGDDSAYDSGAAGSSVPGTPAVAIRSQNVNGLTSLGNGRYTPSNVNSRVYNPIIVGNEYDGCSSGTVGSVSPYGRDGLYQGYSCGCTIVGNYVRRHGVEAIYPLHDDPNFNGIDFPYVISGNSVDCALPIGQADFRNVGIRCDSPSMLISNNTLVNVNGFGIQSDGVSTHNNVMYIDSGGTSHYGGLGYYGGMIANNTITMTGTPVTAQGVSYGVQVVNGLRMKITGNVVRYPAYAAVTSPFNSGFILTGCRSCTVDNNEVRSTGNGASGAILFGFSIFNTVDNSNIFKDNITEKVDYIFNLGNDSTGPGSNSSTNFTLVSHFDDPVNHSTNGYYVQSGSYATMTTTNFAAVSPRPPVPGGMTIGTANIAVVYGPWMDASGSSPITVDFSKSERFTITSGVNVATTRIAFSNAQRGQRILIEFVQAASGGANAIDWTNNGAQTIRWPNGQTPPTSTTHSHADLFVIVVRGDGSYAGASSIMDY